MHLSRNKLIAIVIYFCFVHPVQAQSEQGNDIVVNPEDVASIDAIIKASYDAISGGASDKRDWDRERSLFHPQSRHIPTRFDESGEFVADVTDVEGFIKRASPYFEQSGFYEYEIARKVEQFGNIAHVFSTYEWRNSLDGPVGGRGINSFQLLYDGTRWWIMSVFWQQESTAFPIPSAYLSTNDQ